MSLRQVLRNIRDRGLKDIGNIDTLKSYFEWKDIQKNGILLSADDVVSYSEQLLYRRGKCPDCVKAGECLHCHCDIEGKTISPLGACSQEKWTQMMPPEDWEEFKKTNKIEFIVTGQ